MSDNSHLPLIQKCMDKAEEYEKKGDQENATKWLELAEKAEQYYAKQNNKTAWECLMEIYEKRNTH